MYSNLKVSGALIGLVCIAVAAMTGGVSAESVEIAKKCNALTSKAFPPREVGNPAAGSAKGTGRAERAYFRKCVANGGKVAAPAK